MRFPPSLLDEIRTRLPLSAVVGRRVSWDRRKTQPGKGDYWACCPFHQEKSPSFHADDRRGRYHCFGCGVTGDHFTFVTETEGLSFPEAVQRLANEAGVHIPEADPEAEAREQRRTTLRDVLDLAVRYFEETLAGKEGAAARAYLDRRKISPEARRAFHLGYSTPARNGLKEFLAAKGVTQELMVEAGLLVTGDDIPVSFDRFRDRIIFPIQDFRGRTVAFGGRALGADAQAKYLNSPETPLFQKGSLLYNGGPAREASRTAGTVIAVEGYVDVIAMASAGFGHTVAPLGTALTEQQLQLLWRMAPEPILCFDGDGAGLRAARRAVDLALPHIKPGLSLRFALLPENTDPDDLIGRAGPPAMAAVLDAAMPLIDMLWSREVDAGPLDTPERRAALEQRLDAAAATIADTAVRKHYRQALAERTTILFASPPAQSGAATDFRPTARRGRGRFLPGDWRSARNQGATAPRYHRADPIAISTQLTRGLSRRESIELRLPEAAMVLTVASHPGLLHSHFDDFSHVELQHHELDALRRIILDEVGHDPDITADALDKSLRAAGFAPLLDRLVGMTGRAGLWHAQPDASDADAEAGWLQTLILHRRARALHKELKEAEAALARDGTAESLSRLIEIQNQLSNAEGIEAAIDGFGQSSGRQSQTF